MVSFIERFREYEKRGDIVKKKIDYKIKNFIEKPIILSTDDIKILNVLVIIVLLLFLYCIFFKDMFISGLLTLPLLILIVVLASNQKV